MTEDLKQTVVKLSTAQKLKNSPKNKRKRKLCSVEKKILDVEEESCVFAEVLEPKKLKYEEATDVLIPEGVDKIVPKQKTKAKARTSNIDKKKAANKRKAEIKAAATRTVFIGNAPLATRVRDIKKIFKEYGVIETIYQRSLIQKNAKLTLKMTSTNKKLGKVLTSKIFFVRYKNDDGAQKAAEIMNNYVLDGHNLRVSISSKHELSCTQTVFIGNIQFEATEQEVRNFFTENCGDVKSVRLIYDKKTGKNIGIGYVAFTDAASILTAYNLDNTEFQGRPLRITKLLKKNRKPVSNKPFSLFALKKGSTRQGNRKFNDKQKDYTKLNGKFCGGRNLESKDKLGVRQQRKRRFDNKKANDMSNGKVIDLAETLTASTKFEKSAIPVEKKIKKNLTWKDIEEKKPITKGVRKAIKKRKNLTKRKSLMT